MPIGEKDDSTDSMVAEALVGKVAEQRRVAAELFGASSGWDADGPPLKWLRMFQYFDNMSCVQNLSSASLTYIRIHVLRGYGFST